MINEEAKLAGWIIGAGTGIKYPVLITLTGECWVMHSNFDRYPSLDSIPLGGSKFVVSLGETITADHARLLSEQCKYLRRRNKWSNLTRALSGDNTDSSIDRCLGQQLSYIDNAIRFSPDYRQIVKTYEGGITIKFVQEHLMPRLTELGFTVYLNPWLAGEGETCTPCVDLVIQW